LSVPGLFVKADEKEEVDPDDTLAEVFEAKPDPEL
jgi:hypothetical protein